MTFPILGGNGAVAGFSIDNSLRFNDNDSPNLSRTFSLGDQTDWTFSAWVKRGNLGTNQVIFGRQNVADGSNIGKILFDSNNKIKLNNKVNASTGFEASTNAVFRDVSAWYHIFISFDGNQSTHNDRAELYVNGVEQSWSGSGSLSAGNGHINLALAHAVGFRAGDGGEQFDGYIAEMYFIDGNSSLSHTDFGEFDEDSGIWKPKAYTGSFSGTNSFYLDFEDSSSLGNDVSGNDHDFTATNLASTDQTTDTPTNNFPTINILQNYNSQTISEGNTKFITVSNSTSHKQIGTTFGVNTGKWYWELKGAVSGNDSIVGISSENVLSKPSNLTGGDGHMGDDLESWGYASTTGNIINNNSGSAYGDTWNTEIIGVALDLDNAKLYFSKSGVWQNSGVPTSGATGTGAVSITSNLLYVPAISGYDNGHGVLLNFGQDSSFAGNTTRQNNSDGNGYGNFYYAPPSGYLALCTQNLATALSPTIDDGSAYFHTQLYTGTGSARSVTNDANAGDFKPDWVWFKRRTGDPNTLGNGHNTTYDSSRGVQKEMYIDLSSSEVTNANGLTAFNTDGFSVGTSNRINASSESHVAWQWKANGGTTSSNTDGSITSTVQANTTAGFSIVTFTGNATAGATVGHGLGAKPEIIFSKNRSIGTNWNCYVEATDNTGDYTLTLNGTGGRSNSFNMWNDTAPTSSVITLGNRNETNGSSHNMVHYVFHSVEGYSKFGSYTGNGSSDGTFIYTGFRPAFVMFKRTNSTGNWLVYDTARDTFNVADAKLEANDTDAEVNPTSIIFDILSNGFKQRSSNSNANASSGTYIYMCFSANPFVSSSGVPVTAR